MVGFLPRRESCVLHSSQFGSRCPDQPTQLSDGSQQPPSRPCVQHHRHVSTHVHVQQAAPIHTCVGHSDRKLRSCGRPLTTSHTADVLRSQRVQRRSQGNELNPDSRVSNEPRCNINWRLHRCRCCREPLHVPVP